MLGAAHPLHCAKVNSNETKASNSRWVKILMPEMPHPGEGHG